MQSHSERPAAGATRRPASAASTAVETRAERRADRTVDLVVETANAGLELPAASTALLPTSAGAVTVAAVPDIGSELGNAVANLRPRREGESLGGLGTASAAEAASEHCPDRGAAVEEWTPPTLGPRVAAGKRVPSPIEPEVPATPGPPTPIARMSGAAGLQDALAPLEGEVGHTRDRAGAHHRDGERGSRPVVPVR